jgi:hypothetical protein
MSGAIGIRKQARYVCNRRWIFRVAHTQTLCTASAIAPNHRRQIVMTFS